MVLVQATAVSGGLVGNAVSQKLLGTNMLFHSDRTTEEGTFCDVIDRIGVTSIRYPGGTVTEEYFDITNPDARVQSNIMDILSGAQNVRTKEVTTLSEYVAYACEKGGVPSLVLPTYRYFDEATGTVRETAEADFRGFIRELLSDHYGEVGEVVIELGNEWYQNRFDWTLEEFGRLQMQIASWIDDEASAMGLRGDVTLLVQAGRSEADNTSLASHFGGPGAPQVDGVLTHIYATNSKGNTMGMGGSIGRRLDEIHDAWGPVIGEDFELAVTEWNVGENGEETNLINGIMRSAPLLRVYAEMLQGGVDMAMIWSAHTNGPAGLSTSGGGGSDLSPTGYFYNMLSQSTNGLQLVDPDGQFKLSDGAGNALGYTYSFAGQGRSVTYFASGVDAAFTLQASMAGHYSQGAYVYARILDVAPGDVAQDYWSGAAVTYQTNLSFGGGAQQIFEATLNPYQMVELHIVQGQGVTLSGDDLNYIADELTGTFFDDTIEGYGGNDRLRGRNGDDWIDGGSGRDILQGDWGADTLIGGDGDDFLYGGRGDDLMYGGDGSDVLRGNLNDDEMHGGAGVDFLFGGGGNDILNGDDDRDDLRGQNGNDRLDGGTGADSLHGGGGQDVFVFRNSGYGYDRVRDYEIGQDSIDFTDFAFDNLQQVRVLTSETDYGLKINFGDGNVLLIEDLVLAQFDDITFLL